MIFHVLHSCSVSLWAFWKVESLKLLDLYISLQVPVMERTRIFVHSELPRPNLTTQQEVISSVVIETVQRSSKFCLIKK